MFCQLFPSSFLIYVEYMNEKHCLQCNYFCAKHSLCCTYCVMLFWKCQKSMITMQCGVAPLLVIGQLVTRLNCLVISAKCHQTVGWIELPLGLQLTSARGNDIHREENVPLHFCRTSLVSCSKIQHFVGWCSQTAIILKHSVPVCLSLCVCPQIFATANHQATIVIFVLIYFLVLVSFQFCM